MTVEEMDLAAFPPSVQNEAKISCLWELPCCSFGPRLCAVVTFGGVAGSHSCPHTHWTQTRPLHFLLAHLLQF